MNDRIDLDQIQQELERLKDRAETVKEAEKVQRRLKFKSAS